MPPGSSRRPTAASRTVAEQLAPVVRTYGALRADATPRIDVEATRARIASGRVAFDPEVVLANVGDLTAGFWQAVGALEHAGSASSVHVEALHRLDVDANELARSWSKSESTRSDPVSKLARQAAGLIGSAVLSRAAAEITTDFSLTGWTRSQCPCCGASPDMVVSAESRRTFVCWRCETMWRTDERGCLGCGASEPPTLARIRSVYLGYDLAICHACGRYLKERGGSLRHDLIVERTIVATLDEAAQLRGLRA